MKRLNKDLRKDNQTYPEKVIQFGTGNFLRAFTDWMIDRMNRQTDFAGSIVIIQSTKNGTVDVINEQNGLYTLYLQGMVDGQPLRKYEVISSISRGLNIHNQYNEYLSLAESPALRFVVSNTTEAGIYFDERDQLDDSPQNSFVGKLTAFLYYRFTFFKGDKSKGLIIIPCELIEKNGEKVKQFILEYARVWKLEEAFIEWLHEANWFCNSLVDRIVPGYPKDTIEEVSAELGYEDQLVVVAEQYHLWAIEGPDWLKNEFPAEQAGLNVRIVKDITPFRTSKVRILNGVHTAMTPVAYLYGLDTVGEAIANADTRAFVEELIEKEIIPTIELPKEELISFAKAVMDRFANPYIQHYLTSIALNAISKYKTRNLPALIAYVEKFDKLPARMVFSLSAWIQYYRGYRNGEMIHLVDDEQVLQLLKQCWAEYDGSESGVRNIAATILSAESLWERDLTAIPGLTIAVAENLMNIEKFGMKEAIKKVGDIVESSVSDQ